MSFLTLKPQDIGYVIRQGMYRFEEKSGIKPTDFYLGAFEARLLREHCYEAFFKGTISDRDMEDSFPSEFMGMRPHLIMEERHLSFGVRVDL